MCICRQIYREIARERERDVCIIYIYIYIEIYREREKEMCIVYRYIQREREICGVVVCATYA